MTQKMMEELFEEKHWQKDCTNWWFNWKR